MARLGARGQHWLIGFQLLFFLQGVHDAFELKEVFAPLSYLALNLDFAKQPSQRKIRKSCEVFEALAELGDQAVIYLTPHSQFGMLHAMTLS